MGAVIGDIRVHETAVRHRNLLVVYADEHRVEETDLPYRAADRSRLNIIADSKGARKGQHNASRKVRERTLHCKTQGHTRRRDNRSDRGHGDADNRDHGNHK